MSFGQALKGTAKWTAGFDVCKPSLGKVLAQTLFHKLSRDFLVVFMAASLLLSDREGQNSDL